MDLSPLVAGVNGKVTRSLHRASPRLPPPLDANEAAHLDVRGESLEAFNDITSSVFVFVAYLQCALGLASSWPPPGLSRVPALRRTDFLQVAWDSFAVTRNHPNKDPGSTRLPSRSSKTDENRGVPSVTNLPHSLHTIYEWLPGRGLANRVQTEC